MQELLGRLTALDPEARDALKVVTYFDALVSGGVGVEALLRGAASLSGAVAGARFGSKLLRVAPTGERAAASPSDRTPISHETPSGTVWIERDGRAHVNDLMIVERLALAVAVVDARRGAGPESAIDVALDGTRPVDERNAALARLRLEPTTVVRVCALPVSIERPPGHSTITATPRGLIRLVLLGDVAPRRGPAGIGLRRPAEDIAESASTALLAQRAADDRTPVVDAEELGVLLIAAQSLAEAPHPHPDVAAIERLDARTRTMLTVLVEAESVRAAGIALGMHHSSLQARRASLAEELGWDPRSPLGRTRFQLASLLLRLTS